MIFLAKETNAERGKPSGICQAQRAQPGGTRQPSPLLLLYLPPVLKASVCLQAEHPAELEHKAKAGWEAESSPGAETPLRETGRLCWNSGLVMLNVAVGKEGENEHTRPTPSGIQPPRDAHTSARKADVNSPENMQSSAAANVYI